MARFFTMCGLIFSLSAQNAAPFPQAPHKKGLQVQLVPDAISLGIRHATVNISLGALLQSVPAAQTEIWEYQGKSYHFSRPYIQSLDAQIQPLSDAQVIVYAILLAYPTHQAAVDSLILHPQALTAKSDYGVAAWNTVTAEGKLTYQALISFLAQRYSDPLKPHGALWGYIIGNEVNSHFQWNQMGDADASTLAHSYYQAVRLAHDAIRHYSANARCYLSLDHHWNIAMAGKSPLQACSGKTLLTLFQKIATAEGDFDWHIAYHPYPQNLFDPRTWKDQQATADEDTPKITFKNLEVLTKFLEKPAFLYQKKPRRVILSEQGMHCSAAADGPALQAAGYAYAWEKINRLSGIDALIWHRHVDHAGEGGLMLGLWSHQAGSICTPQDKRPIYFLFQKAGTLEWSAAAAPYLSSIGISSWDELSR